MEYKLGWINFIGDIYLFIVFICCFGLALIFHFLFKIKVNLIVLSGLFIGVGIQLLVLFSNFKNGIFQFSANSDMSYYEIAIELSKLINVNKKNIKPHIKNFLSKILIRELNLKGINFNLIF